MEAHKHNGHALGFGPATWRDAREPDLAAGRTTGRLRSCSYCGSMHPADVAEALRGGARAHWADFKYGWPHKLYLEEIPNPHAGMLESRMSTSHALPLCPRTGAACAQGEQSFSRPVCDCMKAGEPTEATHGTTRMVRVADGFSRTTGAPGFTWNEAGQPAAAKTHGKFYSEHLQDASAEDREVIERAMGLRFTFEVSGTVRWEKFA